MTRRKVDGGISRRSFLAGVPSAAAAMAGIPAGILHGGSEKLHIVSLSFDDGFRKSFIRIAEIYEKFSLSACFNIIASAHMPGNEVRDDYMKQELFGDFHLWNELQDRGHEIMPHGYKHAHLADLPLEETKGLILRCLEIFSKELRGFDPHRAVFNFPYNQSSPGDRRMAVHGSHGVSHRRRDDQPAPGTGHSEDNYGRLGPRQCRNARR